MKRIASLALSLVLLLGCLPAAVAAEGPSSWTEEEVNRAVEVGLVPQSIQGDWQQPVTRGEFAMLVIRYLAVTYGRTDEQLVNDYMTCCPDRNGEFWGEEDFGDGLTWWQRFSDEKGGSYLTDLPTGEQRAYIQSAYHMGWSTARGTAPSMTRRGPSPGRRRPASGRCGTPCTSWGLPTRRSASGRIPLTAPCWPWNTRA